jgi:NTP pyrophosphatase (non-canonical NTP hydrolase)
MSSALIEKARVLLRRYENEDVGMTSTIPLSEVMDLLREIIDSTCSLNGMSEEFHSLARSKGFWDADDAMAQAPHFAVSRLALIGTEVSEAIEEVRKPRADDPHREHLAEELADVLIRTLDFAAGYKLDIEAAVIRKHERNKSRPRMHGKAL